jgi:DNA-binding transcriptional MerR regulator
VGVILQKSSSAFRTISEVAAELDVPKHVLRFWEGKFNQLRPMKRGGGRRYYRPEDVDLLRGIRWLLYSDGYTIKGVQRILRDRGVRFVKECWRDDLPSETAAKAAAPEIPNLAGEAASQARRTGLAAMRQPQSTQDTQTAALGRTGFARDEHSVLTSVVQDLEECRDLLRDAARDRETRQ